MEPEKKYSYHPEICNKSVQMVESLKEKGKFGKTAVDHMT